MELVQASRSTDPSPAPWVEPTPQQLESIGGRSREQHIAARKRAGLPVPDAYNLEIDHSPHSVNMLHAEVGSLPTDPSVFKISVKDPDTLTYNEMLRDVDNIDKWKDAADSEITELVRQDTWQEEHKSQAEGTIIPGTWVFRRKRTPDGTIKKYKARYCVRGDLHVTEESTYSPVVGWIAI